MNLEQLKLFAKKGESTTVEFKKSTALLRAAFETACAFLNNKGGTVLIGVADKGQLIGQDINDNTRREIAREAKKIEPTASIDIDYIEVKENKFVIAIQVTSGTHAPYTYDGRAYQRDESDTNRMSQHRYEQLLVKRGHLNHSWEEAIADDYKISDLDEEEIYRTVSDGIRENRIPAIAQRENKKKILERLDLVTDSKLKRAAVVLYAKQDNLKFVQCMIKMARFKGLNKLGDFIDNQQLYGNAFRLLAEADAFLRRHLPIASFFKRDQFKRIDIPALPVMAVREALINSLCHRDYADRSTDIALAIFDDRLELWNGGVLPKNVTVKDLRHKHSSVLRNKLIANAFYVRGMIEKWGIGTNKMIDLCKQDGIPEPHFEEYSGGVSVTFKLKEPIGTTSEITSATLLLNPRQKEILKLLQDKELLSANEIFLGLQNPPTLRTVKADLSALQKFDLVEQVGRGPGTVWKPK